MVDVDVTKLTLRQLNATLKPGTLLHQKFMTIWDAEVTPSQAAVDELYKLVVKHKDMIDLDALARVLMEGTD